MSRLGEIRERHAARLATRGEVIIGGPAEDDDIAWLLDLVGRQHDQFLELNKVIDDQQERIDDLNDEIANCEVLKYKAQVERVEALVADTAAAGGRWVHLADLNAALAPVTSEDSP